MDYCKLTLSALFSKSTFHQSVMTSLMKIPYIENTMLDGEVGGAPN